MRLLLPAVMFVALEIFLGIQFLATTDFQGRLLIAVAGLTLAGTGVALGRRLVTRYPGRSDGDGRGDLGGGSDGGYHPFDSHDSDAGHSGDGGDGGDGH